ncbi:MAG: alpha/beta hydrolase [Bacillota bacterium]|nr:alpha/beta hydrolase [Bacillota bacterium]
MILEFKGRSIYYELHGSGDSLLVLNGVFMSCTSWAAFVPAFSRHNQLILVDFLDQGRSDKLNTDYNQKVHVETIKALFDHLGLTQASIMGISYGGEVAMQFALAYPERLKKLVLANTTAYTNPWLQDMGRAWEQAISSYDGRQFFKACIPVVYSPKFYTTNIEWAKRREELFSNAFGKDTYDAFIRLIRSAEQLDLRSDVKNISTPTLVLSSEHDYVTPVHDQEFIVRELRQAAHLLIKDAGHAAMYEKPVEFCSAVLGFVNSEIPPKVI